MQRPEDKDKLLVWHAPEVECISKGKIKKPYGFGCKVSLAINVNPANGGHFILSSNALHGKPYDGHTLNDTVTSVHRITGIKPRNIYVDKGYVGHDYPDKLHVFKSGQRQGAVGRIKRGLKRRSSIEPIIGHAKMSHKLDKCRLKGKKGDQINAIFAAIGFNFKQILNRLKKLCRLFIQFIIFCRIYSYQL